MKWNDAEAGRLGPSLPVYIAWRFFVHCRTTVYYTLCNFRGGHGVFTDRLRLADINLLPYYVEIHGNRAASGTFCLGSQYRNGAGRRPELWEWPCP